MNVLITGATGFVGGVLATKLTAQGHRVRSFDTQHFGNAIGDVEGIDSVKGDILDRKALDIAMRGINVAYHLAGIVTDGLVDLNHRKGHRVNVLGTANVGQTAIDAGVKRIVYASSSSVYGYAAEGDSAVTEDVVPQPKTEYAHQKLEGEHVLFDMLPWIEVVAVRSATAMGPAPRPRLDTVVNIFSKQAFYDQRITVHGGSQYRSNVHVQDVADLYATLSQASPALVNGQVFNATLSNQTVGDIGREVATEYALYSGQQAEVVIQDVADPRSYRLDATKAHDVLGWNPRRSIADAARDMFEWFASADIDPNDSIFVNTARMKASMLEE